MSVRQRVERLEEKLVPPEPLFVWIINVSGNDDYSRLSISFLGFGEREWIKFQRQATTEQACETAQSKYPGKQIYVLRWGRLEGADSTCSRTN